VETNIKSLAIFCGSSVGKDEQYCKEAQNLGVYLAQQEIAIIYGGARVGLMGAIADAALNAGGEVIGVIPSFIKHKEIAHENLTKLIEVKSMHERKMTMFDQSDGAIILPGGFGTLDEMFELLTWGQLGLHAKPVGILNVGGFYDLLISFFNNMVKQNLLRQSNRDMVLVSQEIPDLLDKMKIYQPPVKAKWINAEQV
jgi:uncharacterized protein (TIGR00730 family)